MIGKDKRFCVDCGIKINSLAVLFTKDAAPVEYKEGWVCSGCNKKRQNRVK